MNLTYLSTTQWSVTKQFQLTAKPARELDMNDEQQMAVPWKDRAIQLAEVLIAVGASKGTVKRSLVEHFGIQASVAGRLVWSAVHRLYGSENPDPMYWLAQDCGSSTPLQRRLARRRYHQLTDTTN